MAEDRYAECTRVESHHKVQHKALIEQIR